MADILKRQRAAQKSTARSLESARRLANALDQRTAVQADTDDDDNARLNRQAKIEARIEYLRREHRKRLNVVGRQVARVKEDADVGNEINELSRKLVGRYLKKAQGDLENTRYAHADRFGTEPDGAPSYDDSYDDDEDKADRKASLNRMMNRYGGIETAGKKLGHKMPKGWPKAKVKATKEGTMSFGEFADEVLDETTFGGIRYPGRSLNPNDNTHKLHLDVATDDDDLKNFVKAGKRYGVDTRVVTMKGPAGGNPLVSLKGKASGITKYVRNQYAAGDSGYTARDLMTGQGKTRVKESVEEALLGGPKYRGKGNPNRRHTDDQLRSKESEHQALANKHGDKYNSAMRRLDPNAKTNGPDPDAAASTVKRWNSANRHGRLLTGHDNAAYAASRMLKKEDVDEGFKSARMHINRVKRQEAKRNAPYYKTGVDFTKHGTPLKSDGVSVIPKWIAPERSKRFKD